MWQLLLEQVLQGNERALARSISFVENEQPGYEQMMAALPQNATSKIIGITGPPGAGKSTLVDALIKELAAKNYKVGVLCVDPSSPFNFGAVLGDRIRMSEWYLHPDVFIRSLATRGAMGGLHPKIMEIAELLKTRYDFVIVETVGVGQSEVEIAGLADVTVVVLVPEAGDEIQTMKAGLMEIADIFVVNKSDRPGADAFVKGLKQMLTPTNVKSTPVIKTVAFNQTGVNELAEAIQAHLDLNGSNEKHVWLLAERAYFLIQQKRMRNIKKVQLKTMVEAAINKGDFNLYQFIQQYDTPAVNCPD